MVQNLPATEKQLERIRRHQEEDEECKLAAEYCRSGWPSRQSLHGAMKYYYSVASDISVKDGLLMRGNRIVIPAALRLEMLDRLHTGHQGISKCRERARQSLWWPGLSRQLEEIVKNCSVCRKCTNQRSEPLITTALPELPWQRVGTDLFEFKGRSYLLIVDYYSRFIEVALLNRTTAEEVILRTKRMFDRFGIPEVVVSDNGPQYSSEAYAAFARQYQFEHVTSSPRYPQSNGEAQVQTPDGTYRRNRRALVDLPNSDSTDSNTTDIEANATTETNPTDTETQEPPLRRSSRERRPPDRLDPSWGTGKS